MSAQRTPVPSTWHMMAIAVPLAAAAAYWLPLRGADLPIVGFSIGGLSLFVAILIAKRKQKAETR